MVSFFFQVDLSEMSVWSGFDKFYKHVRKIRAVLMVMNCSANFFAYQLLLFRERKMQRQRNEAREMERLERLNVSSNSNANTATRETSF